MLKQPLTPSRTEEINYSLEKMAILSQLLIYEYQMYLVDTRFKSPTLNNFASRVGKDCQEIRKCLKSSVIVRETEYADNYVGQVWRIMDKLCLLDLEPLTEYADYLTEQLQNIGA